MRVGRRPETRITAATMIALAWLTGLESRSPAQAGRRDSDPRRPHEELGQRVGVGASPSNRLLVAWNERAYETAITENESPFKGVRALAMMHIAMHDALNAVLPVYRPYAYAERNIFAQPMVAAAQAAHDVLLSQYPGQRARLAKELETWLSLVPDGVSKARGTALGRDVALAIAAMRERDGWDVQGTYEFRQGLGEYQTTPPWNGFVLQPGLRFARPFGLVSPSQFRPLPPPSIDSPEYAAAVEEVKVYGRIDSAVRTADQTAYAIWWLELTDGSMNRLARDLVTHIRIHPWRAARMFAFLNMSMFDGLVASWDSKYHYNHWRPFTAIRAAGDDGNPATAPDHAREPLQTTPPFPEYVSTHSTVCETSFRVFARTFGDHVPFSMQTVTAPPEMPVRTFASFSQASAECADSRVLVGFHYRYATDAGRTLGRQIVRFLLAHHLRPWWSWRRSHR